MHRLVAATWGLVWVLASIGPVAPVAGAQCPVATFSYKHGVVTFAEHGETTRVRVEVADTDASQEFGLMCRTSLAPDAGMLFWFADTTQDSFWMKNTLIPLSIAFLDDSWRVVGLMDMAVAPDPQNGPFPLYAPKASYRYALEVNQGFFAQHSIDAAAQVTFTATTP